jgi:uncharacterized protein (TIRG00374 family)
MTDPPRNRSWTTTVQIAGVVAVAAGAAWAIYDERTTMRSGVHALGHTRVHWVIAAIGSECVSMVAFALLQRQLLRAVGTRLTATWLLSTAYAANAIAVAVPVAGSGMATGYAFRQLRRRGVDAAQAGVALTMAGIVSTVAFAAVIVAAAVFSGNPAAAAGSLVAALIAAAIVGAVLTAVRTPEGRARLERIFAAVVRWCRRVVHHPKADPNHLVGDVLKRVGDFRFGVGTLLVAFVWALVNWVADAVVLFLVIHAVGIGVPWHRVLLAWTAGIGAGSLSPTPGGLGVVDVTMTAALVAAGAPAPGAVAAVLLYRIVTFKVFVTTVWMISRALSDRRRARVAARTATTQGGT